MYNTILFLKEKMRKWFKNKLLKIGLPIEFEQNPLNHYICITKCPFKVKMKDSGFIIPNVGSVACEECKYFIKRIDAKPTKRGFYKGIVYCNYPIKKSLEEEK